MKDTQRVVMVLGLTAGLFIACSKDEPEPTPTTPVGVNCDTTNVTYETRVNALITQNCRGCHNATLQNGGLSLATEQQVRAIAESGALMHSVNGTGGFAQMPPSGALSACNILLLDRWVANGTP